MGKSPLLADFIHTRACKPICAKLLTLPKGIRYNKFRQKRDMVCRTPAEGSCTIQKERANHV